MSRLAERVREVQIAVMLLTRLPAGRISGDVPSLAAARWAFPLVGVLVGLIVWAAHALMMVAGASPMVAAFVALAVVVLVTGGLHQDGLADFADGLGGGQDTARRLEIMRDSRIGSYGVLALILHAGLWVSAVAQAGEQAGAAFFCVAAMLSRAGMTALAVALPPARTDGLGILVEGSAGAVWGSVLVACLAALALIGVPGLALIACTGCMAALVGRMALRGLSGQTGDVLGATQALCEVACLLCWVLVGLP